ncbi:MAG: hypothetical protein RIA69_18180 [Cyclobacteriaceae bacterium]
MDISSIIFLLLVGLVILGMISIPFTGLYFLNKWLTKKGLRWLGLTIITAFSAYFVYSAYTAIYPTDEFYLDEFKEVTLREAPESTQVTAKIASYPDFHGDYCSASMFTLDEHDYEQLLTELQNDERLSVEDRISGSQELDQVLTSEQAEKIDFGFIRNRPSEIDHYRYIGFLNDGRTIVIHLCVT